MSTERTYDVTIVANKMRSINASYFMIKDSGTLMFFTEIGRPIASFSPGYWYSVMERQE